MVLHRSRESAIGGSPTCPSMRGVRPESFARSKTTNEIVWLPTNLLEANDLVLRTGDALLLTALPAGAPKGVAQIAVVGVTNYSSKDGQPVVHQFTEPGTFSLAGSYLSR